MPKKINPIGIKYHKLLCVSHSHKNKDNRNVYNFKCDCGKVIERLLKDVSRKRGLKSCGGKDCIPRKMNNLSKTKAYQTWYNMIARCTKENHPEYKRYGSKGISVCKEWMGLDGFIRDMGMPVSGAYIDRIDNSKGYYKGNCRWVDRFTSCQHTSKAKPTIVNGVFYNSQREMKRETPPKV